MEKTVAKQRIDELKAVLRENSRRYYVDNNPTMSDFEYDALMRELEDLERAYPEFATSDSPTRKVGSDIEEGLGEQAESLATGEFVKRPHRYPMLSLGNTYSITEIEEFAARAEKALDEPFSWCCELKFDGTAICLTYRNGRLVQALTRGDGVVGDDITANARSISNIPQTLHGDFPEEFEIRGEVLMPYEAFERLNAERADNDEPPFANPRNAASGSLKLQDPAEVAKRGLQCTLYHIPAQSVSFATHDEALLKAASWGLPVSDTRRLCKDINGIREFISHWDSGRKGLPFATDGCVIKINELSAQRALGYTAKSPRWAVAFKFKAEQACTEVLSISYQVGRTGAVTPVANLAPVQLSGTVVKRATLNNEDWMRELDLRVGDWVYVEKGGEIIPKISSVELGRRPQGAAEPAFPKICPDCGTALVRSEEEAKWFCPNSEGCPQQIKGRLVHFTARKAMNILAGEATAAQLYDASLVRSPSDFYDLRKYQLTALEGWQDRSAQKFLDSLAASRQVPFERVLFALGIRYVGETTAREIARHFGGIDAIMEATEEQLLEVKDVGEVIARSVFEYMHDEGHRREVARLRAAGLRFEAENRAEALSSVLEGSTVVVSGNFSVSREQIKELIARHGGKNSSSVTGKTTFLLAGSKPGPEKIRKCGELGIKIMSEEEFRALLPREKGSPTPEEPEQLSLF